MQNLVRSLRDRLLATPDSVCLERAALVTEAWRRHAEEPMPLRRARAFAHVLANMTLDLDSNPVFAGNTSARPRAWMLVPEHGFAIPAQVILEHPCLEGIMEGAVPSELAAFWEKRSLGGNCDPGHLAVDLHRVVHAGLADVIAEIDGHGDTGTEAQRQYRQAMRIALQAVIAWAERYADAAEQAARTTADPLLRACHARVAAACRRVPAAPARNLFEGLQAMALVHLALTLEGHGMSVSIGLPDRILEPFIVSADDPEETAALIAAFMLKIAANSVFGRGSKTQAITVGGADHTGRDCSNLLTRAFLRAADLVRLGDPPLFLRWHAKLPADLRRQAAELLAGGLSMPLLIHDAPTAAGFEALGVARTHAWEYCVVGCNELGIPALCAESANARAGSNQLLGTLNQVLLNYPDPDALKQVEDLMPSLETAMLERLRQARQHWHRNLERLAERAPVPFTSSLMRGCIPAGADMVLAMPYRVPGLYERGLTNAANALAAIEHCVFQRRSFPLSQVVAAMRADFAGAHAATQRELRAAPKWGNDNAAADRWALALLELRERVLRRVDREFGDTAHSVCHVVRSLHYLDGRQIAASADGRRAFTPVADSVGAETGTARGGPTAILGSVTRLDTARFYRGGTNLNITLPPRSTTPETVGALVDGFFGSGGQELQINCFEATTLRAAQEHPEAHGNLVVRVAGLSARFVDLGRVEQDELIARAEAAE